MQENSRRDEAEPQDELWALANGLSFIKRHRRALAAGVVAALLVFAVLACGVYCLLPVHTDAKTELRFVFKGVDQDQYPNGLPFAAEELLAIPVLDEVYRRNGLEAYLKFDQFAKALSVSQSNRQLDALERRYQGLLADKKLTAAERSRIEDDWYTQSQQLRSSQYALHYSTVSRRVLPEALVRKVLADIPMVWAEVSIQKKGVLTYDIASVSPLSETELAAKFPLYALQQVYNTAGALQDEIEKIGRLPGAGLVRPPVVPATVEDLRIGVSSLVRSSLPMIYRDVLLDSLRRQPEVAQRQIDSITNALTIKSETVTRMAANYLTAYQQYMQKGVSDANTLEAVAPSGNNSGAGGMGFVAQIDGSFLDRISGMATQSVDVAYRQKLIDDYTSALNNAEKVHEDLAFIESNVKWASVQKTGLTAAPSDGDSRPSPLGVVVKPLNALVEQADALLRQLSRNNLENGTSLYQTVRPFQMQRVTAVSWRWWLIAWLAWSGGVLLLVVGTLLWRGGGALSGPAAGGVARS